MPGPPSAMAMWFPRADEHELAVSLGLCEADRARLRALIDAAQEQTARDHPGVTVRVYRWHVWRVVRAMHRAGQVNTPQGRSAAYAWLAAGGGSPDEVDAEG